MISSTSVIFKMFERIKRDELLEHGLVSKAPYGFVPAKSCLSKLAEILDSIKSSLVKEHCLVEILSGLSEGL